jgi:chromosome segregation ATPase
VPLGDPLNSTPPAEDSSVTVGTEAESKSTAPDGDNKRIQISKDPDLIQLLMQQEERIVAQQDHKTSNVYMVLELLKRQVSRLPSDRDFHRLKNEWNSFSSKSTDSAESAAKEMSDKVDRKVEADLKEMISWKGRVQAEIESRQTKMETSFQGLLGSFGDLHEESMSGLTELSVFAKSKFESLEEENTRLTAAVEHISDMSNENAKTMEGMQEKMENVETVVKDMNDDVRSSREKLETLTLDMKLNFEETEVKIEDLHALMEELKADLAATTEELTGAQVTLLNLGNDVVSNTDHIAEVFKLGVRDMPERFREIEEVKLVEMKEVVQTNKAVHDEEITTLQRTLKQKAIHIEKLSSQVDTAKRELMAKGEEIKQTQEDVSKGFEDVNEKIAKMKAAQETIDTAIKEEAKTTRGRVKVVETVVPLVAEMETQLTTISEDAFKAKTETEEALGNIQSDVNSTKQAISDSKRHQEKLLSASEKKMRAPVIELKARVDNVEVSTKNSAEQSSMLKRKVEQVAMHVDDSPDALAKDRLLKVVKLCLDFQDTAANNSGQKALTFGDKVQAKMANHAQHLAEYIANRADFACLRQLISGATIEDIMYIHDQVDILRHEMTEDFLKHMVQLVKEKAKVGDDPPKIILEARKIFTHRFRRAIEMSLTKYEQVQVIGNTRIGRVSVPTCVACDRPLVSKGRAKREDANPADGAPSRAVLSLFSPSSLLRICFTYTSNCTSFL